MLIVLVIVQVRLFQSFGPMKQGALCRTPVFTRVPSKMSPICSVPDLPDASRGRAFFVEELKRSGAFEMPSRI